MNAAFKISIVSALLVAGALLGPPYVTHLKHRADVVDGTLYCGINSISAKYITPLDGGRWKLTDENGVIAYVSPSPMDACLAIPGKPTIESKPKTRTPIDPKTETSA